MSNLTITGTPENWDREVLRSELPVLVDFWGAHCAPCRQIAPLLDEIAEELAGRAKVVKVMAQEHMELSLRYHVQAMPTLLVFVNGKVVEQHRGSAPKAALAHLIESHLPENRATA